MRQFLLLGFFFFSFCTLFGDEFEEIEPKEAPKEEGEQIVPFIPSPVEDEHILVEKLRGLVFSSGNSFPQEEEGIHIKDIYIPERKVFISKMEKFLGMPASMRLLQEIRRTVILHYRKYDLPLVSVVIPADQDVTDGVIHYVIIVARLGDVKTKERKYFKKISFEREIRTKRGEIIRKHIMEGDLEWMNRNPFVHVDLYYEPGKDFGETDIFLDVQDSFPLRIYGGYENSGYLIGGESRYFTGFNWGNAWRLGHQFNYLFMSGSSTADWWGHSFSYIAPLPCRHTAKIYGAYVESYSYNPDELNARGRKWELGCRYEVSLPAANCSRLIFGGYEFKRTNNFSSFGEQLIYNNFFDISHFLVGMEAAFKYFLGETSIRAHLFFSPGKMTHYNYTHYYILERSGAQSDYIYGVLHLDHTFPLPYRFLWTLMSKFQLSGTRLLPSEQLSLGGYLSIRGYKENTIIADDGILIKNEIRFPSFPLFFHGKNKDEMQLLAFVDFGWASNIDPNIYSRESQALASFGSGLRYCWQKYISVRLDYGVQLKTIDRRPRNYVGNSVPSSDKHHSRFHLGIVIAY